MSPKGIERRGHKRVRKSLRLESSDNGNFIEMRCKNISLGGASCISDVGFPLMTKLMLHLYLPSADDRSAVSASPLPINGYVVRSDRITKGLNKNRFHLAIFFKKLEKVQAELLIDYLRKRTGLKRRAKKASPSR